IIQPGLLNTNQGPDFLQSRIRIGATSFAGSVELHLLTSHWLQHGHSADANYKNVVLHVVYENDLTETVAGIPVLELQHHIPKMLLNQYTRLMQSSAFIPCAQTVAHVSSLTWMAWKERLLAERLTRKAALVNAYLKQNNNHWEESFWWLLARNFGAKVNSDAFEAIAQSLPINILAKHKTGIHQLEALLLGQAGLLKNKFTEDYPILLQREYAFLQKKYNLQPVVLPVHFLRMRPGNFPTIRLSQLAALIHSSAHLLSKILEAQKITDLLPLFNVTANDYWHYHYTFETPSVFKKKILGGAMVDNIFINTVIPALFAYALYHGEEKHKTKALAWLETIGKETNTITKGFESLGVKNNSAYDSQSLIELKTKYCNDKLCLQCAVGNAMLKNEAQNSLPVT
ncbi:MAG: DUF2851 family protein, partial [Bacteroidota bacterium]